MERSEGIGQHGRQEKMYRIVRVPDFNVLGVATVRPLWEQREILARVSKDLAADYLILTEEEVHEFRQLTQQFIASSNERRAVRQASEGEDV